MTLKGTEGNKGGIESTRKVKMGTQYIKAERGLSEFNVLRPL